MLLLRKIPIHLDFARKAKKMSGYRHAIVVIIALTRNTCNPIYPSPPTLTA
jgi:hypothetical protein